MAAAGGLVVVVVLLAPLPPAAAAFKGVEDVARPAAAAIPSTDDVAVLGSEVGTAPDSATVSAECPAPMIATGVVAMESVGSSALAGASRGWEISAGGVNVAGAGCGCANGRTPRRLGGIVCKGKGGTHGDGKTGAKGDKESRIKNRVS